MTYRMPRPRIKAAIRRTLMLMSAPNPTMMGEMMCTDCGHVQTTADHRFPIRCYVCNMVHPLFVWLS
jgi:ribosomal protein S27E